MADDVVKIQLQGSILNNLANKAQSRINNNPTNSLPQTALSENIQNAPDSPGLQQIQSQKLYSALGAIANKIEKGFSQTTAVLTTLQSAITSRLETIGRQMQILNDSVRKLNETQLKYQERTKKETTGLRIAELLGKDFSRYFMEMRKQMLDDTTDRVTMAIIRLAKDDSFMSRVMGRKTFETQRREKPAYFTYELYQTLLQLPQILSELTQQVMDYFQVQYKRQRDHWDIVEIKLTEIFTFFRESFSLDRSHINREINYWRTTEELLRFQLVELRSQTMLLESISGIKHYSTRDFKTAKTNMYTGQKKTFRLGDKGRASYSQEQKDLHVSMSTAFGKAVQPLVKAQIKSTDALESMKGMNEKTHKYQIQATNIFERLLKYTMSIEDAISVITYNLFRPSGLFMKMLLGFISIKTMSSFVRSVLGAGSNLLESFGIKKYINDLSNTIFSGFKSTLSSFFEIILPKQFFETSKSIVKGIWEFTANTATMLFSTDDTKRQEAQNKFFDRLSSVLDALFVKFVLPIAKNIAGIVGIFAGMKMWWGYNKGLRETLKGTGAYDRLRGGKTLITPETIHDPRNWSSLYNKARYGRAEVISGKATMDPRALSNLTNTLKFETMIVRQQKLGTVNAREKLIIEKERVRLQNQISKLQNKEKLDAATLKKLQQETNNRLRERIALSRKYGAGVGPTDISFAEARVRSTASWGGAGRAVLALPNVLLSIGKTVASVFAGIAGLLMKGFFLVSIAQMVWPLIKGMFLKFTNMKKQDANWSFSKWIVDIFSLVGSYIKTGFVWFIKNLPTIGKFILEGIWGIFVGISTLISDLVITGWRYLQLGFWKLVNTVTMGWAGGDRITEIQILLNEDQETALKMIAENTKKTANSTETIAEEAEKGKEEASKEKSMGEKIQESIQKLKDYFGKGKFTEDMMLAGRTIGDALRSIGELFSGAWEGILSGGSKLLGGLSAVTGSFMTGLFGESTSLSIIDGAMNYAKEQGWQGTVNLLGSAREGALNQFKHTADKAAEATQNLVTASENLKQVVANLHDIAMKQKPGEILTPKLVEHAEAQSTAIGKVVVTTFGPVTKDIQTNHTALTGKIDSKDTPITSLGIGTIITKKENPNGTTVGVHYKQFGIIAVYAGLANVVKNVNDKVDAFEILGKPKNNNQEISTQFIDASKFTPEQLISYNTTRTGELASGYRNALINPEHIRTFMPHKEDKDIVRVSGDGGGRGFGDVVNYKSETLKLAEAYMASNGWGATAAEATELPYDPQTQSLPKPPSVPDAATSNTSTTIGTTNSGTAGLLKTFGLQKLRITSPYGMRMHPIKKRRIMHGGIDISWGGCNGSPIKAVADGRILAAGWGGGLGYYIDAQYPSLNSVFRYAHLQEGSLKVKAKDSITAGQVIGAIGSTGRDKKGNRTSTGPHLHLEVYKGSSIKSDKSNRTDPMVWKGTALSSIAKETANILPNATKDTAMSTQSYTGKSPEVPVVQSMAVTGATETYNDEKTPVIFINKQGDTIVNSPSTSSNVSSPTIVGGSSSMWNGILGGGGEL